jgi:hypothetical protein
VYLHFDISPPRVRDIRRINIVTVLINTLLVNSTVNTVQHATIEEAVFSVDPTDGPIDWLDSDHVICVYCRSMSIPWQNLFRTVTSQS